METNKTEKLLKISKKDAFKIIDKVASKGVIHKNKAANQKSRISRHLNSLS